MISTAEIENFNKKFDVVSVFVEHDGKILLLHRQDHKPQGMVLPPNLRQPTREFLIHKLADNWPQTVSGSCSRLMNEVVSHYTPQYTFR